MTEAISVFDMFKVGIGPSSSHTLGPWRAAGLFRERLHKQQHLAVTTAVQVHLYGSLALTGIGHGTDLALLMGLSGHDPRTVHMQDVRTLPDEIRKYNCLALGSDHFIAFDPAQDILFHYDEQLPYHANGMRFLARDEHENTLLEMVIYSTGGGFIVVEGEEADLGRTDPPYPIGTAKELLTHCLNENASIWEIVIENERSWYSEEFIEAELTFLWDTMEKSIFMGCHTGGELPGGLHVKRRAADIHQRLLATAHSYVDRPAWKEVIRSGTYRFPQILKWIGCFAMAVNEENANFGRIVTSPTNGSAGVIPAVMMYYICFTDQRPRIDDIARFLLTAGVIGAIFKQRATISAAMGGCQAEIGVSSAMAAAGLTEVMGGSIGQVLMAAEIAMEHHLGLTCDPIGGLVQVPCIERNSMGAVKAITAAEIALESDPEKAKVSLDKVVDTMWETAQDMHTKYKETSKGGLATNVSINISEC